MAQDRFGADKRYTENLAKGRIKDKNVLDFNDERSSQTSLYLFAMALGVNRGVRTPSRSSEGLILSSAFFNVDMAKAFVYSVAIQELRKEGRENEIQNAEVVNKIAEEYANTGFKIIEEELVPDFDHFDEEMLELQLMDMLDEKFDEIRGNDFCNSSAK